MARPDDAQLVALLDEADEVIARLRRDGPEVLRRARAGTAGGDGYPNHSGPVAGGASHGDSSPERIGLGHWSKERQADPATADDELAGLPDDPGPYARGVIDPVRRAANGMVFCLRAALGELRKADGDRDQVVGKAAQPEMTPVGSRPITIGSCWVCDQPSHPLVAGMCRYCLAEWDRAGRPDRAAFRLARRQGLAGGRLLQKVMARVVPDEALRLPAARPPDRCALCGHQPPCARVPAWNQDTPVLVCDHCYEAWIAGQRPD